MRCQLFAVVILARKRVPRKQWCGWPSACGCLTRSEDESAARAQDAVPADNSLVSLMLRTRNKETGAGLTDLQVVAQTNTFIAAGAKQLRVHGADALLAFVGVSNVAAQFITSYLMR